jgi:hypothetical protein
MPTAYPADKPTIYLGLVSNRVSVGLGERRRNRGLLVVLDIFRLGPIISVDLTIARYRETKKETEEKGMIAEYRKRRNSRLIGTTA